MYCTYVSMYVQAVRTYTMFCFEGISIVSACNRLWHCYVHYRNGTQCTLYLDTHTSWGHIDGHFLEKACKRHIEKVVILKNDFIPWVYGYKWADTNTCTRGTHWTCVSCCVGRCLPGVRPGVLDCSNAMSYISSAPLIPVGNLKGCSHGEPLTWKESNRATWTIHILFTFSTFSARGPLLTARTHRGTDKMQEMRYSMYTT